MKTPREILLGRHTAATPALDAIRARAVARIAADSTTSNPASPSTFAEFLFSLRWHAAAMAALWLLAAMLSGTPPKPQGSVAQEAPAPPPMPAILAWRDYARDLEENNEPAPRQTPPPIPHACIDPRPTREPHEIA
jgi:hypothetical protein